MEIDMRLGVLAVAATCIMLAGCSSGDSDEGQTSARPPATGLDTSSGTPSSSADRASGGSIPKTVGQVAALGCTATEKNCTDLVNFTVTDISTTSDCSEAPAAGKRFLHVAASISTSPDLKQDELAAGNILNVTNWQVLGADGFTTTRLDVATACNYTPGPFYDSAAPGTKQRGDVVFAVPADAKKLTLFINTKTSWVWQIPA